MPNDNLKPCPTCGTCPTCGAHRPQMQYWPPPNYYWYQFPVYSNPNVKPGTVYISNNYSTSDTA